MHVSMIREADLLDHDAFRVMVPASGGLRINCLHYRGKVGSRTLNRRSFGAAVAVGVPVAMSGYAVRAQTPAASPATAAGEQLEFAAEVMAVPPNVLLDRLASTPLDGKGLWAPSPRHSSRGRGQICTMIRSPRARWAAC